MTDEIKKQRSEAEIREAVPRLSLLILAPGDSGIYCGSCKRDLGAGGFATTRSPNGLVTCLPCAKAELRGLYDELVVALGGTPTKPERACSFCDKTFSLVAALVTRDDRPGPSICDECIALALDEVLGGARRLRDDVDKLMAALEKEKAAPGPPVPSPAAVDEPKPGSS